MARQEFISLLCSQHATFPELLSRVRAGPAGLDLRGRSHWDPGGPLLAIFSGAGRSLTEPRGNRGAPAGLGGGSRGLRCPLVSRGRWHCPAPSAGAPEVPAVLPPARRCRGGAGPSRPGPGSGARSQAAARGQTGNNPFPPCFASPLNFVQPASGQSGVFILS